MPTICVERGFGQTGGQTLTSFLGSFGAGRNERDMRADTEWDLLVQGIRIGDKVALEELYRICRKSPASVLTRSLPLDDVEDAIHTVYLTGLEQIRRGDLKEPSKLVAYLIIIARRHVCRWIRGKLHGPSGVVEIENDKTELRRPEDLVVSYDPGPERLYLRDERQSIARAVLNQLSDREREILQRFYVQEQSEEEVREAMNLTPTQFRLAKWRAKTKAAEVAAAALKSAPLRRPPESVVLRIARTQAVA
jgi:RNA polymerase sigma-70 factor, ECF subfamily